MPRGMGVGLRGPHVPKILGERPLVPWFELLTDNHLATGGALRFQAEAVAEHYPVTLHGVGMSLGGVDPVVGGSRAHHLHRTRPWQSACGLGR